MHAARPRLFATPLAALLALLLAAAQPPAARAGEGVSVLLRTELGDIVIAVDVDRAPVTAANFLAYVDEDLFAGAHFYRVVRMDNQPHNDVKIEVIQGGLGFDEADRRPPIEHEATVTTGIRHLDGAVSMARLEPGSASSEFFICVGDQPELDFGGARNPDGQGFAAFARVVGGMDVVRAIHAGQTDGQMLTRTVAITEIRRLPAGT